MKDFAKSIVCNTKAGNSNKAEIIEKKKKEGATLKVDNGQKLEFSDGSTYVKTSFSDDYREAHNYTGNSKVGNGITKFGLGKYVIADGHKAIVLGEKEERGPNGIPFGWVTIRWVEGPWKGQSDQYYDYDLKKTGNKKVGNANTHLTASNSGELWLNFDGTGEMYDPIELGRYDFSGKSEALSVARELEQLKRKAEQRVKDADKFINAIKQWAAGLK